MKKLLIVLAVAAAVLAPESVQSQPRPAGARSVPQSRGQMGRTANRDGDRGARSRRNRGDDGQISKQDQQLIEGIESADSSQKRRKYLQAALSSRSEDVRMAMVDALAGEEDKQSVTDLAYFIADPSEDVADAAFSAWTMAVSDISRERRVRAILETAQILQGRSNGLRQGHGAPGGYMAAPGMMQPPMR